MIKRQINNILLCISVLIFFSNCNAQKTNGYTDLAFKKYLLDNNKINANSEMNDKLYDDYYMDYLHFKTKQKLDTNPFIKVNKVYMYKQNDETFVFCVFSERGFVYNIATTMFKNDNTLAHVVELKKYADVSQNKIIKFDNPINLSYLGSFELENDKLTIERSEKTPFKEWKENDIGYFKNDTLTMTESYKARKQGNKKKWLATTYKTNFKFIYQPNLKAIGYKNQYGKGIAIEGSFDIK